MTSKEGKGFTCRGDAVISLVSTENAAQPQRWEVHFTPQTKLRAKKPEDMANSNSSEKLLQRGKGGGKQGAGREEARIYRSFCNKHQIVKTSKDYCKKKTRYLQLRN